MGAFISRQPNGLLCRFSTIVDCLTHYNMTEEDYIEECAERAREKARRTLEYNLKPFEWIEEYFVPNNMTEEEFDNILKEMHKEGQKMKIV